MEITLTSKTTAKCSDFMKIVFDSQEFSLEDFSAAYKKEDFSLDELLKSSSIIYRGQCLTYKGMCQEHLRFSESLPFFSRYHDEIYPSEYFIMVGNSDYYKSAKFLNKAEKCLQTARYYLIKSKSLISTDFEINWNGGYGIQFMFRTIDFTTSVIWYNNCFDYILQIIYLAFKLYLQVPRYKDTWTFEDILQKCSYKTIKDICLANNTNSNVSALWKIVNDCHTDLLDVNKWANFIKHKGGINFDGLTPDAPFSAVVKDMDGSIVAETSEFDAITIDLDQSIPKLQTTHAALYTCLDQIVSFIDYPSAIPQNCPDKEGLIIPNKNQYVKILLP